MADQHANRRVSDHSEYVMPGVKLVRDRMREIPWEDENVKQYLFQTTTNTPAYRTLLRDKVFEESAELANARTMSEVIEESADLYEVILAMIVSRGIAGSRTSAEQCLQFYAQVKFKERGGFVEGLCFAGPHPTTPRYTTPTDSV